MSTTGATSAFRGYRLQTLYIVSRLLGSDNSLVFQPEGIEDLDVYSPDGILIQSVQVKAHSANLSVTTFDPQKPTSFFRRVLKLISTSEAPEIRIISFGPVGPELDKALAEAGAPERQKVLQKLQSAGYTLQEAKRLVDVIDVEKADEMLLEKTASELLRNTLVGGDPENALHLLMYWVSIASEQSQKISYDLMMDKLSSIGRYLSDRLAYHDEWFVSIHPLHDVRVSDSQKSILAEEYYQGVDARYEHIVAGLDVLRNDKLDLIVKHYDAANVVIVHGASGQGKSTLAYRYLHDRTPDQWRFLIRFVQDRNHAMRVARALSGHAKAIKLPLTIYLDIAPNDTEWTELVRELTTCEYIHILVTIREEDWRRTPQYRVRFRYEALELKFDRQEAKIFYAERASHSSRFLSFDDAWRKFGSSGPLLEFAFLTTQNVSLRERLAEQIAILQDRVRTGELQQRELDLLRLVAVASSYHARLDLAATAAHLKLEEPKRILHLFEREYLIRVSHEQNILAGLHAVRSTLMLDYLLDESLVNWLSIGQQCIPLLIEDDIETYLLHSFSRRHKHVDTLLDRVNSHTTRSWKGTVGILRALLWLGIREYVDTNRRLLDEMHERLGQGWYLFLDFDLVGISEDLARNWWRDIPSLNDEAVKFIESARSRQTSKRHVFIYAMEWLAGLSTLPTKPEELKDWSGMAEVIYWAYHFRQESIASLILSSLSLSKAIEELPLDYLGQLILAISYASEDAFDAIVEEYRFVIEKRYRTETSSFHLEDDGELIRTHFLISLADLDRLNQDSNEDNRSLHDEAMYRVELLRRLYPNRKRYGCQGYGHQLGILSSEIDDTTKTGISASSFPPIWAQVVNGYFHLLGDYCYRDDTWHEYVDATLECRTSIVEAMQQLITALTIYFRKSNYVNLASDYIDTEVWEKAKSLANRPIMLPKCAVDEWGLTGEGVSNQYMNPSIEANDWLSTSVAMEQYRIYIKIQRDYFIAISNFMTQATQLIAGIPVIGRSKPDNIDTVTKLLDERGINIDRPGVSVSCLWDALEQMPYYHREFSQRFGAFYDISTLRELESAEMKLTKDLWSVWYQFVFHPRRKSPNPLKEYPALLLSTISKIRRTLKRELRRLKDEGINASLLDINTPEDIHATLWLQCDVEDASILYEATEKVVSYTCKVLGDSKKWSLRFYTVGYWMQKLNVIQTIRGKALDQNALEFPLLSLSLGYAVADDWRNYIPRELDNTTWARLGIQMWDEKQFEIATHFLTEIGYISGLSLHLLSLIESAIEVDELGEEILASYIGEVTANVNESLQTVFDLLVELVEFHQLDDSEVAQRTHLVDAISLLSEIQQEFMPTEDYSEKAELDVESLRDWAQRLEQLRPFAAIFRLHWIADTLDNPIS